MVDKTQGADDEQGADIVSIENFLVGTIDKLEDIDQWLHTTRAQLVARLRALQVAQDPAMRGRLARIADRLEKGDLPPLDDPNFLHRRLAENTEA
jgi:hypothetical protein